MPTHPPPGPPILGNNPPQTGIGFWPYLTEVAAIGTTIAGQLSRKSEREKNVRLADERIALEMEYAANDEVYAVEELARAELVAFGQIFNTGSSVPGQSYTETAIAQIGVMIEEREIIGERTDRVMESLRFEALDARAGNDVSSVQLFSEAFTAGNAGFQAGLQIEQMIKASAAAKLGQENALEMFDQESQVRQAQLDEATMSRRLMALQVHREAKALGISDEAIRMLTEGVIPHVNQKKPGLVPPGSQSAAAAQNLAHRRGSPIQTGNLFPNSGAFRSAMRLNQ